MIVAMLMYSSFLVLPYSALHLTEGGWVWIPRSILQALKARVPHLVWP